MYSCPRWVLRLLTAFLSLALATKCGAILVNVTIDDSLPDPVTGAVFTYSPAEAWRDGRIPCSGCTARPEPLLLHDRTWHDSTFNPQPGSNDFPNTPLLASVKFSGTAIYVYCALARTISGPTGLSDMTFFIDGQQVGRFINNPPGTQGYDYDVLVYHNTTIPAGDHEFTLQNGNKDGPKALVLFDRIVYTYDNGLKSEEQRKSELAAILGGTLGGLAVLCTVVVVFAFWFFRVRKRRSKAQSPILETSDWDDPRYHGHALGASVTAYQAGSAPSWPPAPAHGIPAMSIAGHSQASAPASNSDSFDPYSSIQSGAPNGVSDEPPSYYNDGMQPTTTFRKGR